MNEILKRYHDLGWNIIPTRGKVPKVNWGEWTERKQTEEDLESLFSENSNVAVICGRISNLCILDIDTEEGKEFFKSICQEIKTPISKTRRGFHIFFAMPSIDFTTFNINGIDFKGNNSICNIPPSIVGNHKYEWIVSPFDTPPANLPQAFIDIIQDHTIALKWPTIEKLSKGKGNIRTPLKKSIVGLYSGVKEGERNIALTRLVGSWMRDGLTLEEAYVLAGQINERFDPPLPEKELISIINSIYKISRADVEEREKVAEVEVVRARTGFKVKIPVVNVYGFVRNLSYTKDHLAGYLKLWTDNPSSSSKILYSSNFNFHSARTADSLRKTLEESLPLDVAITWKPIVENLREKIINLYFEPDIKDVEIEKTPDQIPYLIAPLIFESTHNAIYAEGGIGKTTLALLLACASLAEELQSKMGLHTDRPLKVLYLDYENQFHFIASRLKIIAERFGIPSHTIRSHVIYKNCTIPLTRDVEIIQNILDEKDIDMVIVDSVGKSLSGDISSAESINEFFRAVDSLQTTTLLLHHMAKNIKEKEKATPYGSVYFINNCRNIYHLAKNVIQKHKFFLTLFHRKCNYAELQSPVTYNIEYNGNIDIDLSDTPVEALKQFTVEQAIIKLLYDSNGMTITELADEIGRPVPTIKVILSNLKKKNIVFNLDKKWFVTKADIIDDIEKVR